MTVDFTSKLGRVLNSASDGLSLAQEILNAIDAGNEVALDFAQVYRVTPSYSNALVMTLLHAVPLEELRGKLRMLNRSPVVLSEVNESVRRFQRGSRLTNQQRACA